MGYGASTKSTFTRTLWSDDIHDGNSDNSEYWNVYDVDGFVLTLDVTKCESVRAAKKRLEQQEPQKTPIERQVLIDEQGGTLCDQEDVASMPNGCCVNLIRLQNEEGDEEGLSTVQLRGLPFQATEEDVKEFFRKHAKSVMRDLVSVHLLLNSTGRPSGFARVTFSIASAAASCQKLIHGKYMGSRYVEVVDYPTKRRDSQDRARKAKDFSGNLEATSRVTPCTPEQLASECKLLLQQMGQPVLLSKLGEMLSQDARAAVKVSGSSLKKFLTLYPDDFLIEGWKSREYVTYRVAGAELKTAGSGTEMDNKVVNAAGDCVPPDAWGQDGAAH